MANMCVGKLKIRGTKGNLSNFFQNALQAVSIGGNPIECNIEAGDLDYAGEYYISLKPQSDDFCHFHLKGTHRGFVSLQNYEFDGVSTITLYDDREEPIVVVDYEQAWDINTYELVTIAREYNVDLRIYGFEGGMAFNRDIIIVDGDIVRDEVIKFDDYTWECINPYLGG